MITKLRAFIRRFGSAVLSSRAWLTVEIKFFVRSIQRTRQLMPGGAETTTDILICTNGGGNLGDQAMFEAFLSNTSGTVVAVMRKETDFFVPPAHTKRVEILAVGHLLTGRPSISGRAERTLLAKVGRAATLTVVGADILDGAYNPREALVRTQLMRAAALNGIPAHALGFSWSPSAHPAVIKSLLAGGPALTLRSRDPLSLKRLHQCGIAWAELVTDTVFSLPLSVDVTEPVSPYIVLNVSGLIHSRANLSKDYLRVVRFAWQQGLRVVVLPHVRRHGDDDLGAAEEVFGGLEDGRVVIARDVDSVAAVVELARGARWVLTGRMHLAILAMSAGTPAMVLSTQGKVEGLLALFDLEELALEPRSGFADRVESLVSSRGSAEWRRKIENNLPRARALSRKNFQPYTH